MRLASFSSNNIYGTPITKGQAFPSLSDFTLFYSFVLSHFQVTPSQAWRHGSVGQELEFQLAGHAWIGVQGCI